MIPMNVRQNDCINLVMSDAKFIQGNERGCSEVNNEIETGGTDEKTRLETSTRPKCVP